MSDKLAVTFYITIRMLMIFHFGPVEVPGTLVQDILFTSELCEIWPGNNQN